MNHILVVEDDSTIAAGIEYSLQQEGFTPHVCYNAQSAREKIKQEKFTLIILDVALPDGNGFDLCKMIRERTDTPIIFLTACDEEVNVVMGLDLGADDYITKPFRVRELISRIKSILRRYNLQSAPQNELVFGKLKIIPSEAKVYKNGEDIPLTALEYKLLLTLANCPGQVLSRNQILEGIWDVAINKLLIRNKSGFRPVT